ncbi:non-cyanogenic beta-glucosidase [Quercus suber]|uniref:Non-cyanogenic beta-glucosidase n=1 Tax=Quercus suber TaxID=58331 RepID=A0AAW0LQ60_QUESU
MGQENLRISSGQKEGESGLTLCGDEWVVPKSPLLPSGKSEMMTQLRQKNILIKDCSNGDVAINQYHWYKLYIPGRCWDYERDGFRCIQILNIIVLSTTNLQPFVTLFYWDLPQALEDEYGGVVFNYLFKT